MGRIYSVDFSNVSVAAVQDLISIQATAGMAFSLHSLVLGQTTATTVGNLRVTVKRFSGAYSIGSGGSSSTPVKMNFGDPAATVTGRVNDTTPTSGGTAATLVADVYNPINGYQFLPPPEDRPVFAISQALIFSLDTAPSGGETTNGTAVIEELF